MPKKKEPNELSPTHNLPVPTELVERRIHLIRNHKVMLDQDLAELYEVEPRTLVQAVKRNLDRFPEDFMFQLNDEETTAMRSQSVIASKRNVRYLPYAFTEQGIAMLSTVLRSQRAIQVNIAIMRAFVKMRQLIASNEAMLKRLESLEKKTDARFKAVFEVMKRLTKEEAKPKSKIGFRKDEEEKK